MHFWWFVIYLKDKTQLYMLDLSVFPSLLFWNIERRLFFLFFWKPHKYRIYNFSVPIFAYLESSHKGNDAKYIGVWTNCISLIVSFQNDRCHLFQGTSYSLVQNRVSQPLCLNESFSFPPRVRLARGSIESVGIFHAGDPGSIPAVDRRNFVGVLAVYRTFYRDCRWKITSVPCFCRKKVFLKEKSYEADLGDRTPVIRVVVERFTTRPRRRLVPTRK